MKKTSLAVRLDKPKLSGDEIQRMAVGILNYAGILDDGLWPEFTTHIEIVPNPEDECFPTFNITMCESEEDEAEIGRLEKLVEDFNANDQLGHVLHFEMKRQCPAEEKPAPPRPAFKRDIVWSKGEGTLAEVLVSPERNDEIDRFVHSLTMGGKKASLQDIVNALNERGDLNDNEWTVAIFALGYWNAKQGY